MKTEARKRVMGYLRVSDVKQVDNYSLDAQQSEITRWCKEKGLDLLGFYREEGRSARTDRLEKRPEFQRMLADAKSGSFNICAVHSIDRFSRNLGVQRQALAALGEAGAGFGSVKEDLDYTTSHGRLVLNMMGAVSEFFSDQLGFHVSKAQKQRAETGLPSGPIPFGYYQAEPCGVPVVDEVKAEAVRSAFARRACGESNGAIAEWLNDQGLRTKAGNRFTAHAMKDMFNCRFYVGVVSYKDLEHPGQHQAIVSDDMFQAVQNRRRGRPGPRRTWGPSGILQGFVACGNCGESLQSDRSRFGDPMYRERHSHECSTNGRSVMSKRFDAQIGQIVCATELPADWRQRMASLVVSDYSGPSAADLREKLRRLGMVFVDGGISETKYRHLKTGMETELKEATAVIPPSLAEAAELFENIDELWKEATGEERRKLLSPLIERVYVDMEHKLVGAIVPTPAFRALLQCAVQRSRSEIVLVSQDDLERLGVWSWWRRGRIELPVQRKNVRDLLQA